MSVVKKTEKEFVTNASGVSHLFFPTEAQDVVEEEEVWENVAAAVVHWRVLFSPLSLSLFSFFSMRTQGGVRKEERMEERWFILFFGEREGAFHSP